MPNMEIVICPFYITHSSGKPWQNTVTCERIKNKMGFKMRNMLRFYEKEELESWLELFCSCQEYKECPYYKSIFQKYEENPDLEPEWDQYEQYEELEIRKPHIGLDQINLFQFMEGKNEDFNKEIKK